MMVNGVENGAASNARIDGVDVAGKTGTAENGEDDPYTLWFTGFAPADDPQVCDHGRSSRTAGGWARTGTATRSPHPSQRQVLEAVLNK